MSDPVTKGSKKVKTFKLIYKMTPLLRVTAINSIGLPIVTKKVFFNEGIPFHMIMNSNRKKIDSEDE